MEDLRSVTFNNQIIFSEKNRKRVAQNAYEIVLDEIIEYDLTKGQVFGDFDIRIGNAKLPKPI